MLARAPGPLAPGPVEAEHQGPEEDRLQAAEGEQVEPDDHLGGWSRQQHQGAEDQGCRAGRGAAPGPPASPPGVEVIEVEIFTRVAEA